MEDLIEKMRTATANDATDEARAAGAQACRTLLTLLEAKPGESMAIAVAVPAEVPVSSATPLATVHALASALRGMTPDQLMDVAIAKLRTIVPPDATHRAPAFSVPFIQVPRP